MCRRRPSPGGETPTAKEAAPARSIPALGEPTSRCMSALRYSAPSTPVPPPTLEVEHVPSTVDLTHPRIGRGVDPVAAVELVRRSAAAHHPRRADRPIQGRRHALDPCELPGPGQ